VRAQWPTGTLTGFANRVLALVLAAIIGARPGGVGGLRIVRQVQGIREGFAVDKFGVLAGRPSCCRLVVVLMLALAAAGCADEKAPSDITAPGPVIGLNVRAPSSTDTSVALHWTNPVDADFTGVMIRRSVGATPPATATSGTLVRDLIDDVPYVVDIGGVTAGTQYSYALFAHDGANNYAAAAKVTYSTTTAVAGHGADDTLGHVRHSGADDTLGQVRSGGTVRPGGHGADDTLGHVRDNGTDGTAIPMTGSGTSAAAAAQSVRPGGVSAPPSGTSATAVEMWRTFALGFIVAVIGSVLLIGVAVMVIRAFDMVRKSVRGRGRVLTS
jgi:hypothetical protein